VHQKIVPNMPVDKPAGASHNQDSSQIHSPDREAFSLCQQHS
jgi:hypothetical protein